VVDRVTRAEAQVFGSDCPMAGRMIEHGYEGTGQHMHPITMVRRAYGI
jgi:hypothetical protein